MYPELKSLNEKETVQWANALGLSSYRGTQIRRWLFKKYVLSFREMTDLPKDLREKLSYRFTLTHAEPIKVFSSNDGTKKYLFRLFDGYLIESVLIPEKDHYTLCISSQVGCAMDCKFCFTGRFGLKRNLSAAEIVDQVIQVKRQMPEPQQLTNIVFMGMGEPLANYEQVIRAIHNIVSDSGMNFSHRKVTLSTCGLVPMIDKLGKEVNINLAISLNASSDHIRSYLMPINKKYPLQILLDACQRFPLPNRRMITFEYILINKLNDTKEDALRLCKILRHLRAKINLIPFNPHEGIDFETPPMEKILDFQKILIDNHFTAIIRKSKGSDIMAACGQLSGMELSQSSTN